MPTGITTLDPILEGGVPTGSLVLLLGEIGAGNYEFLYSSIVNTLGLNTGSAGAGLVVPKKIRYVTFTRLKEDVKHEIAQSFPSSGSVQAVNAIQFDDLSEFYFDTAASFPMNGTATAIPSPGCRNGLNGRTSS